MSKPANTNQIGVALKYYSGTPNAGDLFSRDVASRYIGPVTAVGNEANFGSLNVMLVGSLIHWCDRHTVVCGTGMISPQHKPPEMPKKIIAVRGPRTRALLLELGADVPKRFGDPGALAGEFVTQGVEPTHEYGVVLHDVDRGWARMFGHGWLRRRDDTLYIDIRQGAIAVIDAINRCNTIFSSSLHGLIFAHALQKNALWVRCSDRIIGGTFKFFDYFESLGVAPHSVEIEQVRGAQDLRVLADRAQAFDVTRLIPEIRENLAEVRHYVDAELMD